MTLRDSITCLAFLTAFGAASAAPAATMTFDALPDEGGAYSTPSGGKLYEESGITAESSSGILAWFDLQGSAHIDDSGTPFTADVTFTMAKAFDAAEFTIVSDGYFFTDYSGPLLDNIFVTGVRDGSIVASSSFVLSDTFGLVQTFTLGGAFSDLDALRIDLARVYDTDSCDAPCGHFNLDEITLAPVPLPAGLPMLGLALAALIGLGRRKRTS